jgi:XTP/dITP diphosphohydrolase
VAPIRRLVIATHNRKKAGEMVQILSSSFTDLEILTLADYPDAPEPDENGQSYAENAAIKAYSAAAHTGEWSLADDAGLEIDALGGEPGLWSKRFAGEDTPFPEKMAIILDRMRDVPDGERGARFRCCVALAPPQAVTSQGLTAFNPVPGAAPGKDGKAVILEATCEGRIGHSSSGAGGFGYDPIFLLPEKGCTMADLTAEEKHAISHRGKVLRQFAELLVEMERSGPRHE